MKINGVIEDWIIIDVLGEVSAFGYAKDFERNGTQKAIQEFEERHRVITSKIFKVTTDSPEYPDQTLIHTRNSVYLLGSQRQVPASISPLYKSDPFFVYPNTEEVRELNPRVSASYVNILSS